MCGNNAEINEGNENENESKRNEKHMLVVIWQQPRSGSEVTVVEDDRRIG